MIAGVERLIAPDLFGYDCSLMFKVAVSDRKGLFKYCDVGGGSHHRKPTSGFAQIVVSTCA